MNNLRYQLLLFAAVAYLISGTSAQDLYAQTLGQTQPPVACPLEGPSIADTLKYINDALPYSDSRS
jgi:hypothetical protein